ncbi:hypothetical protein AS361_04865 [Myroides marinus]|uniref:exodeoxyribonuclease V subunit gamma n=1 Tax=Myroides marinus TaxID=703342 RepID=UPI000741C4A5|nr:exodeoxyribonuclease V subunit gamma [Myroides marinus]KUF46469.1 hypothetical protein AS361_04865 [Myroides marinus]
MNIYQSIIFQDLIDQLAKSVKESKNTIFQTEYIVGANLATKTYIKEQLAIRNGIAANLSFISFDSLLQTIFKIVQPNSLSLDIAKPNTITNYIFDALSNSEFILEFPEVSSYYNTNKRKQFGLAQKMYQLFNNYLKYQPELLDSWQNSAYMTFSSHEFWQARLWKIYQDKINQASLYDGYTILKTITNSIDHNSEAISFLKQKLPVLHYIQTTNSSTFEIELIRAIAKKCEVHFYSNTIDQKSFNEDSLVHLWSKSTQPHNFNIIDNKFKNRELAKEKTDLHKLQNTLLSSTHHHFQGDKTLQIHGHFTAFREIEGLLNSLIDKYQSLSLISRNITVYCNGLTDYIPAIHYFFNHPKYSIPYRILGEYNYNTDTAIHALSSLLDYDGDQMDPEQIITLIQYPSISKRFGLDNIDLIRQWISQANIRFQYQGDKDLDMHYISWKTGLDRLFLGSCTGQDNWYDQDILMIDAAEAQTMDMLISFHYFVDNLYNFKQKVKSAKTISEWILYTQELIEFFFDITKDSELEFFSKSLADFETNTSEKHEYSLWLLMLNSELSHSKNRVTPNVGGITFTELKNAQILPCSITAVLGMNYNNYPSQNKSLEFDLLKHNQEFVDKSARENDKFTILNAILQTSDTLYISYLSHNPRTNDQLPSSILLEQLLDIIQQKDCTIKTIHHPLQRYNTRYNQEKELVNYTLNKQSSSNFTERIQTINHPESLSEINLSMIRITNFFIDSFKHFYNYNLGVYINEQQNTLPSSEVFELDTLDNWQVRNYFFSQYIDWYNTTDEIKAKHIKHLKAQGLIPLNHLAEVAIDKAFNKYSQVYSAYFHHIGKQAPLNTLYEYQLTIGQTKYNIQGSALIKDQKYYLPVYSSNSTRSILEWLFTSYILFENDLCTNSYLFINQDKGISVKELTPEKLNLIMPKEKWNELMNCFHTGNTEFTPFYIPFNLKDYQSADLFLQALFQEEFISDYCTSEIFKPYFLTSDSLSKELFKNYQRIFNLITTLHNVN